MSAALCRQSALRLHQYHQPLTPPPPFAPLPAFSPDLSRVLDNFFSRPLAMSLFCLCSVRSAGFVHILLRGAICFAGPPLLFVYKPKTITVGSFHRARIGETNKRTKKHLFILAVKPIFELILQKPIFLPKTLAETYAVWMINSAQIPLYAWLFF